MCRRALIVCVAVCEAISKLLSTKKVLHASRMTITNCFRILCVSYAFQWMYLYTSVCVCVHFVDFTIIFFLISLDISTRMQHESRRVWFFLSRVSLLMICNRLLKVFRTHYFRLIYSTLTYLPRKRFIQNRMSLLHIFNITRFVYHFIFLDRSLYSCNRNESCSG